MSKFQKEKPPKRVRALPDLEQAKSAVLNTLTSVSGQRTYDHAINGRIWPMSEWGTIRPEVVPRYFGGSGVIRRSAMVGQFPVSQRPCSTPRVRSGRDGIERADPERPSGPLQRRSRGSSTISAA